MTDVSNRAWLDLSASVLYDPKEMEAQLSKQGERQRLMLFPLRPERDWLMNAAGESKTQWKGESQCRVFIYLLGLALSSQGFKGFRSQSGFDLCYEPLPRPVFHLSPVPVYHEPVPESRFLLSQVSTFRTRLFSFWAYVWTSMLWRSSLFVHLYRSEPGMDLTGTKNVITSIMLCLVNSSCYWARHRSSWFEKE